MANYNKQLKTPTSLRLGPVRFSYTYVFEKRINEDGTPGKYSVCCLIPKSDKQAYELINAAYEAAKAQGKTTKWGNKIPAKVSLPLHDGDEERPDDPNFAGHWFFNASSKNAPGVQVLEGGVRSDALDAADFYSGCYGAVTVNLYPYSASGNNGVAFGLNNVIKTEDGEHLGGGHSADEDFGDL